MREESKARTSCFPVSLKSKKNMAMCAKPVSDSALRSLIIAELIGCRFITHMAKTNWRTTYEITLLLAPAVNTQVYQQKLGLRVLEDVRFPLIQIKEVDSFQFRKALLSMNHVLVPS